MYAYEAEKPKIFTDSGQMMFLAIMDASNSLLKEAGAFREAELLKKAKCTGDSWQMMACIDRLVELGKIVRLPRDCWRQYSVYTSPKVDDY